MTAIIEPLDRLAEQVLMLLQSGDLAAFELAIMTRRSHMEIVNALHRLTHSGEILDSGQKRTNAHGFAETLWTTVNRRN